MDFLNLLSSLFGGKKDADSAQQISGMGGAADQLGDVGMSAPRVSTDHHGLIDMIGSLFKGIGGK